MTSRFAITIPCAALLATMGVVVLGQPDHSGSGEQAPATSDTSEPSPAPNLPPLLRISISPESRVKVDAGGAAARLKQGAWTEFPIVIENAAHITAPLVIESSQAMRGEGDTSRDRWLKIALEPAGQLTGRQEETRTLRLWSRDAGKRSAVLNANAGQGTQDLGFRSDALFTFDITPAGDALEELRDEATNLLNTALFLVQQEPTPDTKRLVEAAWCLYDGWLRHAQEHDGSAEELLADARAEISPILAGQPLVDLSLDNPEPLSLVRGLNRVVVARQTLPSGAVRYHPRLVTPEGPAVTLDVAGHRITVPVKLTEPAVVRGVLLDGSSPVRYPGRVFALGSDGVFRKGERFQNNPTLSEKNLLPFIFTGRGANYSLPFFYSDGRFEVRVPPGRLELTLERGFEHPIVTEMLDVQAGETREVTLRSTRFIDMRDHGWVSGDTHIHWSKNSWSENEDIELLKMVQRAEDLRVANNLTLKHHTHDQNFTAPAQFPMGPIPGLCDADFHAQQAEEWRNEEFYGHIVLLNIKRLIEPVSTGFMGGPPHFWDWPPNTHAIQEARRQGGISIEAHGLGRNNDVPVNVAQGLSDSLDQMPPDDYYRFLDCGFRIPLSNGSDHPARVAGSCRVYVKTAMPFSYGRWIDGIRENRTFTTSGPLLFLEANGHDIGDVLDVEPGTPVVIKSQALSRHPLGRFQILVNGRVVTETHTDEHQAELAFEFKADEPAWIVARASRSDSFNALDGPDIAHTSAIYIDVNGTSRFVPGAAEEWIRRMEIHAADLAKNGRFRTDAQRNEAVGHVRAGIAVYQRMLEQDRSSNDPTR